MKNQKGVTLITLTITIVVLMILTFTITVNFEPYHNQNTKTKFETDMQRLKEEVAQYYTRVKDIPIINKYTNVSMLAGVKNINDSDEYYVIDIGQLDLELNYGADYYKIVKKPETEEIIDLLDVYIINKQTHTIYYPKGVEYDGMKHYRVAERYNPIIITVEDLRKDGNPVNKDTVARDSYGNIVWIPEGFKVAHDSADSVTGGVVIEDGDIKVDGKGENRGNQYVWIPVGEGIKKSENETVDITLGRYAFADGTNHKSEDGATVLKIGTPILKQDARFYEMETGIHIKEIEPDNNANHVYTELNTPRIGKADPKDSTKHTNTTALNLGAFVNSVKAKGGYYIARYEASYGTDGYANSKVSNSFSTVAPPTSEGELWHFVTQIDAANACRGLYENVITDLVNSYAWDTAVLYIQKFSGDEHYSYQNGGSIKNSLTNTGVNNDIRCNIHDMACNLREWNTEYCNRMNESGILPTSAMGGWYGSTRATPIYKGSSYIDYGSTRPTFRSILYFKAPEVDSEIETQNTYKITYNISIGTMPTNAVTEYTKDTETFTLPTPTGTNYVFEGWYDNAEFKGEKITQISKGTTGDIQLFAKEYNKYKITYNISIGTMPTNAVTEYTKDTETFTLPTPTGTDYVFEGWYDNAEFKGEKITQISKGTIGDIQLFAKEYNTYKITYNISIGTMPTNAVTEYTKDTETFNLPTPTGTNYVFAGWYDNKELKGTKITQIKKGEIGNRQFFAKEHQHTGKSGQTYSNGCYTTKQAYGGSCGGHTVATSFNCGWCGTTVYSSSTPSSCPNNVCGSKTSGQKWYTNTTETTYHSSASGCDKWTYQYRYVLGCGW